MQYAAADHAFFSKLNRIRIAWPFFLVSSFHGQSTRVASVHKTVSVLTRSEIQGLFADELDRHPAPLCAHVGHATRKLARLDA